MKKTDGRTQAFYLKAMALFLCGPGLMFMPGCRSEPDAEVAKLRLRILTDQLPSDVMSLAELDSGFKAAKKVRVVGRIFADQMSPFDPDSGAFSLIELPKPGHDHENPGDCPFCKREMENAATAIIQIVDESGKVLNMSAEQLLELEKNHDIVVEGEATKAGEILIVNATHVHVLNSDDALLLAKQIHGKLED